MILSQLKRFVRLGESEEARMDRHLATLASRREGEGNYTLAGYARTRSVFVHIPKTAGVSVVHALYGNLGAGHLTMRDYERALGKTELLDRFNFAFVRNPWDRLYSAYSFMRAGGMNKQDRAWAKRTLGQYPDFENFVMRGIDMVRTQIHFVPQVAFLTSTGDIPLDFLGFYENLAEDFEIARAMVNPSAVLARRNPTKRQLSSYRDVYTLAMIDRVAEAYRDDIDAFGYVFDGSSLVAQLQARPTPTTPETFAVSPLRATR